RRIAHLHVTNVFPVGVLGQLEGDALEGIFLLHDLQGELETLQVIDQGTKMLAGSNRCADLFHGVQAQREALLAREIQDGFRPQGSVQMDVQVRLGELLKYLEGDPVLRREKVILRHHRYKLAHPKRLRPSAAPWVSPPRVWALRAWDLR